MVKTLSWVLPLAIFIAAVMDVMFVWIFMRHAHPWKGILTDEKENEEKRLKNRRNKAKHFMRRHIPDAE